MGGRFNHPSPVFCGCYLVAQGVTGHPMFAKRVYDTRPSVRCIAIDVRVDPSCIHTSCSKPVNPAVIARSLLALQSERRVRISAVPL